MVSNAGGKSNHKLIPIKKAYNDAKKEAMGDDITLQLKKELIGRYLDQVKNKMSSVRKNAERI
jgi:hypothetical protein